jgi:hypothetical protein
MKRLFVAALVVTLSGSVGAGPRQTGRPTAITRGQPESSQPIGSPSHQATL